MSVSDWSTSAALNTLLAGINIGPGMARADVDNAIRALMAELKTKFDETPEGTVFLPQYQRLLAKLDNNTEDANVVLIGDSTGNETTEWYYLLAVLLGARYPKWTFRYRFYTEGVGYDAGVVVSAGTGARSCTFWNASISGSVANRHSGTNFGPVVLQPQPDLIFSSYGHNGGANVLGQLDLYNPIIARMQEECPDVPVVLMGQNPTLSDETMAPKVIAFRALAARNGYGFVDVHGAFKQSALGLPALMADSVHPNGTGSALWRDTVAAGMLSTRTSEGAGSIRAGGVLGANATIAEFSAWQKNNVNIAKNTTNYETKGHSIDVTNATAAAGWLWNELVSANDIIGVRGEYVTVSVRMRVPTGNVATSGRIDLLDGVQTITVFPQQTAGGFTLFTATIKVDTSATYLRAYFYPTVEAAINTISIDRVTWAVGLAPQDVNPPNEISARKARFYGVDAAGITVSFNGYSGAVGHRFVATETADPSTAWTSDFSSIGFAAKNAADANARALLQATGLFMGTGGAAPIQVVGTRKTGWATATGTATRTTFDTATVTLPQLAERVKALIDDLHATAGHGIIGA